MSLKPFCWASELHCPVYTTLSLPRKPKALERKKDCKPFLWLQPVRIRKLPYPVLNIHLFLHRHLQISEESNSASIPPPKKKAKQDKPNPITLCWISTSLYIFFLSLLQKHAFRFSTEQHQGNIWTSWSSLCFVEKDKDVINLIIPIPQNLILKNPWCGLKNQIILPINLCNKLSLAEMWLCIPYTGI